LKCSMAVLLLAWISLRAVSHWAWAEEDASVQSASAAQTTVMKRISSSLGIRTRNSITERGGSAVGDHELHAAVLRAPCRGPAVGDGAAPTVTLRRPSAACHAPPHEVLADRLGALPAQAQIVGVLTLAVGVPLDPHPDGRVVLERLGDLVEQRERHRLDGRAPGVEEDGLLELDPRVGDDHVL